MYQEAFGNRRFANQASAPISGDLSARPQESSVTPYGLTEMDETALLAYLKENLFNAETNMYGNSSIEAKLLFLGASNQRNIARIRTAEGKQIYAKRPNFMKHSEIDEFQSEADRVVNAGGSIPPLVSEAGDVFKVAADLIVLDAAHANTYDLFMTEFAQALGWTRREALLVADIKYHQRLIVAKKKEPEVENGLIEKLLKVDELAPNVAPRVHTPTFDEIMHAYEVADRFRLSYLQPRYALEQSEKALEKSSSEINS